MWGRHGRFVAIDWLTAACQSTRQCKANDSAPDVQPRLPLCTEPRNGLSASRPAIRRCSTTRWRRKGLGPAAAAYEDIDAETVHARNKQAAIYEDPSARLFRGSRRRGARAKHPRRLRRRPCRLEGEEGSPIQSFESRSESARCRRTRDRHRRWPRTKRRANYPGRPRMMTRANAKTAAARHRRAYAMRIARDAAGPATARSPWERNRLGPHGQDGVRRPCNRNGGATWCSRREVDAPASSYHLGLPVDDRLRV